MTSISRLLLVRAISCALLIAAATSASAQGTGMQLLGLSGESATEPAIEPVEPAVPVVEPGDGAAVEPLPAAPPADPPRRPAEIDRLREQVAGAERDLRYYQDLLRQARESKRWFDGWLPPVTVDWNASHVRWERVESAQRQVRGAEQRLADLRRRLERLERQPGR
jgi:hypothetical protein